MLATVTGAGGFLGSALVRALVAGGYQVRAIVRPGSKPGPFAGVVEVAAADITDGQAVRDALAGSGLVFHAAGLHSLSEDERALTAVNVLGTRNVLRAAADMGVRRVVVTSSATTAGSAREGELADEEGVWDLGPLAIPYFTSMFLAEVEALRAAAQGLDVVVVNPGMMVGEYDRATSPTARWLVEFLNGRLVAVPPVQLNVVGVDDVARGQLLAAERGRRGERYLLTHWNTTAEELFTKLGQLVGRRAPIAVPYEVAFAGATVSSAVTELLGLSPNISASLVRYANKRMWVSNAKAVRELGFETTPMEETLEKAIRWFNASGLVKRRL